MNRFTQTTPKVWIQDYSQPLTNLGKPAVDQTTGDVYIAYNPPGGPYLIKKFDINGIEDTAYSTAQGTGFDIANTIMTVQPDGKLLICTNGFGFNSSFTATGLVRLNSDGTLDTAFNANLGLGFNSNLTTVEVQSDGKILVGGGFTTLNLTPVTQRFNRLNPDGTLDTTFNTNIGTGVGINGNPRVIKVLSNGTILIGNDRTTFNGTTVNRLTSLNPDGTLNTTYQTNLGTGFNSGTLSGIAVLSDDSVVVGGNSFTTFNGNTRNRVVKLNPDGTEDTTFYTNMGGFTGSGFPFIARDSNDNVYVIEGTINNKAVTSNGTLIYFMATFGIGDAQEIDVYLGDDTLYQWINASVTYKTSTNNIITWTCPAGVTEVLIHPINALGSIVGPPRTIQVVPNTSYNVVIKGSTYLINNPNTFGSLYIWTGSSSILLTWVE